ncbi:hypothetical protein BGZ61DRAFT_511031 [Ilyonectria robusta]|uniref:uncharacterized protein n=1 Tax=Ilyonectria robusta TaxID=1079257 RepID=UPI001E8E2D03|nr:uncharacterized protein BGZ61DRAFT_511031 [Ilyonectria robusta]KAH8654215.1 hypothetical protein BGZ61DRAFT_511031 [Ilyonectria robusta]
MAESGSAEAKTQPHANLDGLGIFWIVFALSWTLIVAGGMIFLWRCRDMPILRIRGLPLSFLAITLLHLYWGAVQTGYVYFRLTTPEVEYWIMSIYLPCGIALFHASNSRFLHVAKAQKELFASDAASINSERAEAKSLVGRFRSLNYTRKILILVGVGMSCQFFLTVFMYLISRKFHPSFGIPGTEVTGTEDFQKSQMGRGWEWWPSVFWQFFWAWIVAPYILWHARGINDTLGWRTQTIACCLLSLHATPMWLIALYIPAMSVVNKVWVPPQWIAISIMMLEIFTIFFPCWEVFRHQTLRQETLDSINQWQLNKSVGKTSGSIPTGSTKVAGSSLTVWSKGDSIESSVGESILTMEALECVLERNPEPLQKFSALRDFSGENIAFLRAVAEWQSSLPLVVLDPEKIKDDVAQELVCERFNSALRIYINFISSHHAKFQINLSSQDLKRLASVFEPSARILYGEKHEIDPATPFDSFEMTSKAKSSSGSCHGSETGIMTGSINETEAIGDKALYWGDIPDGFDATIFHDAESSIKYLVFTNTWPKFVKDRQSSINSNGNLEAGNAIPATR